MTLEEAIVISIQKYYDNHELGDQEEDSEHNMVYTNKFFDEQEEELLGKDKKESSKKKAVSDVPAIDEEEVKGLLNGL